MPESLNKARLATFALALTMTAPLLAAETAAPPPQRQRDLLHLLRHDCGSCHGMRMTGGLGPPLTPAALNGKPDDLLTATVLLGRPGTPMPPWQGLLSEADAVWLVERLREGLTP